MSERTNVQDDRQFRRLLLTLIALAFAWAAIVVVTGGIEWRIAGVLFRSRDPARAVGVGFVLVCVYGVMFPAAFARHADRATAMLRTASPALAGVLGALLAAHAIAHGTFAASGSDSYGYVNQAYDWAIGQLPQGYPLPLALPVVAPDAVQVPLGYVVGAEPRTMVPIYAPGLPLLMAAGIRVAGSIGPYLVVPACAGLYVWFTFALGRHLAGPVAGLVAGLLVSTSPVVLFQAVWPMSDVPAGAFWTGATATAIGGGRRGAAASGMCTAAGLLIRPNLLPLALVPLVYVVFSTRGRERLIRAGLFLAPVVLAAGFVALLNRQWYGAPTHSGYGTSAELYSLESVWPNLHRYALWLWQSQSPWLCLAAAPFVRSLRVNIAPGPVRLCAAMFVVTLCCYIAYFQFDDWWYLRFLLPALGAFFALVAAGLVALACRIPGPWGRFAGAVIVTLMTQYVADYATTKGVFGPLREAERRYIYVGEFIRRTFDPSAIVLSMQHSGSIRFYGGRMTLRYDRVPPEWAPTIAADLDRLGYHPYLVLDDWEVPHLKKQFRLPGDGPLPWRLIAHLRELGGVTIFDMWPAPGPPPQPVALAPSDQPLYSAPQPLSLAAKYGR